MSNPPTSSTPAPAAGAHTPSGGIGINPKYTRVLNLMSAAQDASDWLCACKTGTDQRERGDALKRALTDFEQGPTAQQAIQAHKDHQRLTDELEIRTRQRDYWQSDRQKSLVEIAAQQSRIVALERALEASLRISDSLCHAVFDVKANHSALIDPRTSAPMLEARALLSAGR